MKLLGTVAVCRPVRAIHGGKTSQGLVENDARLYFATFRFISYFSDSGWHKFLVQRNTRTESTGEAVVTREFQAKF